MIRITRSIAIDPDEIVEHFVRASGPGGQNVNKVSSAVQLRFDIRHSPSLPSAVAARAEKLAGKRLTRDGVIVISADRFRTQERNRQDALERLCALLKKAAQPPTPRKATKPTKGSKRRRLDTKKQRGQTKTLRGSVRSSDF